MPAAAPVAAATAPSREGDSLVGRVLGDKYGVTALIGEGGMGAVYEAEHLTIGRHVALKVLHPKNARRPDAVQRFHHEARVAGSIGHPNICEIYDVGRLPDGTPFLVMERLFGEGLSDRIAREGALPFLDVIEIVVQVLSALVAAHAKGVIHRDIKPENIFLSARTGMPPMVKLLDFGISKVEKEEELHLTRTGMVMGTPFYMAPEQARGDRTIDHRIDLYATGALLYESLTGRRPFTAPNYNALLVQILSGTPRPLRELRPALPARFEAITAKALAKSRDDRYASAEEFLRELATLREQLARPDAAAPRSEPPPAPQPRLATSRPPPASVEIPVHFTASGPYLTVSSGELLSVDVEVPIDVDVTSVEDRGALGVPREASVSDTFVDGGSAPAEWPDAEHTEVMKLDSYPDGHTPVHGTDLREVRRKLQGEKDVTEATPPMTPEEAEEVLRGGKRPAARALRLNPLKPATPAAAPGAPGRVIPREEPAAPPPPRRPLATPLSDDDAPTTFFQSRPRPASVAPSSETLGDDDEIGERDAPSTMPAPPPSSARPPSARPPSAPRPPLAVPRPGKR
ncbi:MAG: serine/threonine protein kinase [Polyangiaceae bacterium]|nr:serine/threonine protein kinase [Polyangiaceae bacterium]